MIRKEPEMIASLDFLEEKVLNLAGDRKERLAPNGFDREDSRQLILFHGPPQILRWAQQIMCRRLCVPDPPTIGAGNEAKPELPRNRQPLQLQPAVPELWVLDGANAFDPFLISRQAQEVGALPEEYLRRVRVSRSFTAHQMLSLLRHLNGVELGQRRRDYLLLGPLTSFYDENVPLYEARLLFQSFRQELRRLCEGQGILLLVCQQPAVAHQRRFASQLVAMADQVFGCREKGHHLFVQREKGQRKAMVYPDKEDSSLPLEEQFLCGLSPDL